MRRVRCAIVALILVIAQRLIGRVNLYKREFMNNLDRLDEYKDSPEYRKVHEQIKTLGLIDHIEHLDEYGYTVIPPELVAPEEFQERLRAAVLDVHERRSGEKIDLADIASTGLSKKELPGMAHWAILEEDPIFQDAVLNPTVLTVGKYLCGESALLSDITCLLKQRHEKMTHPLHTDQHGTPPPLPPYAQVANVTWALTEYTKDNGPVAIVPKSHLKGRYPLPEEMNFLKEGAPVMPIPIEAAAGSLIVWRGDTWHGSFPRETPGLRLNLIVIFTRCYMRQIRDFKNEFPRDILEGQSDAFARLLGMNAMYPFEKGKPPKPGDSANQDMMAAGRNPWA